MEGQPPTSVRNVPDLRADSEIDYIVTKESCETLSSTDALGNSDATPITVQESFGGLQNEISEEHHKEPGVEGNPGENEWLDILGSGDFKKKIIKCGSGSDSRPDQWNWVTANITCYDNSGDLIENHENFKFRLGDLDVIQGLEMAVPLMELGERAEVLVPARLAYGKFGREPDIPPESDLKYDVEILAVEDDDDDRLSFDQRLKIGNDKKEQGNYWYGVGNYFNAIKCYQRAAEYLDGIDGSDNPPEKLQLILGIRINVNNNLAAAHLKMEAHDAALKSLDFVLKMQPNNVKAHFRKGKVLAAKGMTADALAEMKIAAKLEPESKAIQSELQKLQQKKKVEDSAQKAMYQRMFGSTSEPKSEQKSWSWFYDYWSYWSLLAGGMAALAASVVAYRQFHYAG